MSIDRSRGSVKPWTVDCKGVGRLSDRSITRETAPDGVVEAVNMPDMPSVLDVLRHPVEDAGLRRFGPQLRAARPTAVRA